MVGKPMQKFKFHFDSALRSRHTQLHVERAKLNTLLAEEAGLKEKLERLGGARHSASQSFAKQQSFSPDVRLLSGYLIRAEARATTLQDQIRKRHQLVLEQRERVIQAERNVRFFLKLRQRQQFGGKGHFERGFEANAEQAPQSANLRP